MPGLALYKSLDRHPAVQKVFLLHTSRELDTELLSGRSFNHLAHTSPRWPGLDPELLSFPPRFLTAIFRCLQFTTSFHPTAIIGLGGYGCVPAGLSAAFRGIPLILLEQNVIPGRAVRLLAPHSDLIAAQWRDTLTHLHGGHVRVLGNPIRPSLKESSLSREQAVDKIGLNPNHRVLLVMGGSQGASALNEWMISNLDRLTDVSDRLSFIHLTGENDEERVRDAYENTGLNRFVKGFHESMEEIYPAVDLVLSRAGGTALAELLHFRLPSVLIPYPHAIDDHQRANAEALKSVGGAMVLEQSELDGDAFQNTVLNTIFREKQLLEMRKGLSSLHKSDPSEQITRRVLSFSTATGAD